MGNNVGNRVVSSYMCHVDDGTAIIEVRIEREHDETIQDVIYFVVDRGDRTYEIVYGHARYSRYDENHMVFGV
jgi:hypothetical protein